MSRVVIHSLECWLCTCNIVGIKINITLVYAKWSAKWLEMTELTKDKQIPAIMPSYSSKIYEL